MGSQKLVLWSSQTQATHPNPSQGPVIPRAILSWTLMDHLRSHQRQNFHLPRLKFRCFSSGKMTFGGEIMTPMFWLLIFAEESEILCVDVSWICFFVRECLKAELYRSMEWFDKDLSQIEFSRFHMLLIYLAKICDVTLFHDKNKLSWNPIQ